MSIINSFGQWLGIGGQQQQPAVGASVNPAIGAATATTQQPGQPGLTDQLGIGMNLGTLKAGVSGVQAIGNFLMGKKALGLARDQFNYQKQITDTNLNNQIQTYNTALQDRANSRAAAVGAGPEQAQAYYDKNALSR